MADLPDFLSDEPSSAPEPAPAPEAPAPEPAPSGDQPPAPAAAAPPTSPAEPPQPHHVPLTALLDEREKRSNAEKEARELREWRQQQEAAAQRRPVTVPDRHEDPEAYEAFQAAQQDQALFSMRLDMSRGFAETRHGAETVNQAYQWGLKRCDEDQFFNAKVRASKDPVALVVAEWQREQIAGQMTPDDFAAFQAWKLGQTAGAPAGFPPQAAPAAPAKPVPPRPSIASGPSAGASAGVVPRDGAATFDAMFGS